MMIFEVELISLDGFAKGGKPCLHWCPLDTFKHLGTYSNVDNFGKSKIGSVRYIPRFWGAEHDYAPYYALFVGYRIKGDGETLKEVLGDDLIENLRKIKFYGRMIEERNEKLIKLLNCTW